MTRKDGWRVLAVCLVLSLGTFALYSPALNFSFVNYDDPFSVINNPHVNKGLAGAFGWAFQSGYGNTWQPLTWLSHALDCQIYGLNPAGHHATNLILHALNSALVFVVLRRLTGAFWRSAAVAAFFAWHPLHVEVAAWISERQGLLCAFFWLLTLWAYACYAENSKARLAKAKFFYIGAVVLFALSLMSKPAAVTLPVILLLLDWWPLGRLAATPPQPVARQALILLAEKAPFFVLSAVASVMTIIAMHGNYSTDLAAQLPFKVRFVTAGMACFRYLSKSFWPSDLGAQYPFVFHWSILGLTGVALVLLAISIATGRAMKTRPYWLAGWLWFLVALLPMLNLVQGGGQPMADRNMYIPSIGLWMLICWEAYDLFAPSRYGSAALGVLCAVLLAACCVLSSMQLGCWRNEGTLLARIPESNYNAAGHADYAAYLMHHGQSAQAQAECEKAIAISPNFPPFSALLGHILLEEGKIDQSIAQLQLALRLDNSLDIVRLDLGRAFLAGKRVADATMEFKTVLHNEPNNFEAYNGLAHISLIQGKAADAAAQFRASLKLDINQPDILNDLAWVLATNPHAEIRNGAEAVQLASRACAMTQAQAPAFLGTLAAAFAETGDFDNAVKAGQKAHDLAMAQGRKTLADSNLQLVALYRAHKPFREKK
jgi:protein O-mannosyl-transferase